jgi:hypothetical protein
MPWIVGEHVNTPLAIPGVYMAIAISRYSTPHHLAPQKHPTKNIAIHLSVLAKSSDRKFGLSGIFFSRSG